MEKAELQALTEVGQLQNIAFIKCAKSIGILATSVSPGQCRVC
jgi:hypothetical protein